MRKWAMSSQGEVNPDFEVLGGKHWKHSGSGREVKEIQAVVALDSLERASKAILALEGAAQEAFGEADKELKMVS